MNIVIKKPVISEKSMKLAGQGWYTFIVDKKAAKPAISQAIEDQFKVDVAAIKTVNFKEKSKLQKSRRGSFTVASFKKAIVALKSGQKIGLFEAETKDEEPEGKESKEAEIKEKKSLLKGTKVKIEKEAKKKGDK